MKIIIKSLMALAVAAPAVALTGCMEDVLPTSGATGEQLKDASLASLSTAVMARMTKVYSSSGSEYTDIGFPSFALWRESMANDFAPVNAGWDYFNWYATQVTLGNWYLQTLFWDQYYMLIGTANSCIGAGSEDVAADLPYLANGLTYRAMAYFDLARMYEWRTCGVDGLDQTAASRGITGLTVPLVTEKTTEQESRHNARAPFEVMYRFILNDLDRAERCLRSASSVPDGITFTSLQVVQGLKARVWLELASRFSGLPDDLAKFNTAAYDDPWQFPLAETVGSAADCYRLADKYAQLAMSGHSPLTRDQWYSKQSGFNSPQSAWLWAITYGANDDAVYMSWQSFVSFMSPEATWGVCCTPYKSARMIDAALFSRIPQGDWRRYTFADPADLEAPDAEQRFEAKYKPNMAIDYASFADLGAYVGYKFHPAGGETSNSTVGNAISFPTMRVEEMWFIHAEATAALSGFAAGQQVLETFMNSYRWEADEPYASSSTSAEEFAQELLDLKRVEFWGEGIVPWDYKRAGLAVQRKYEGSNFPDSYQFNSYSGCCPPWMNLYIPDAEKNLNTSVILNPDTSGAIQ